MQNLRKIAQKYIGVSNPYGFLTDLRNAIGIPNMQGASKYGEVTIPKNDGSVLQVSLRKIIKQMPRHTSHTMQTMSITLA